MEYVSMLAKEPWSDRPQCAASSIASFCIWINDNGMQKHRDELMALAPRVMGTRKTEKPQTSAKIYSDFAFWSADEAKKYAESAVECAESAVEFKEKLYDKAIETLKLVLDSCEADI